MQRHEGREEKRESPAHAGRDAMLVKSEEREKGKTGEGEKERRYNHPLSQVGTGN